MPTVVDSVSLDEGEKIIARAREPRASTSELRMMGLPLVAAVRASCGARVFAGGSGSDTADVANALHGIALCWRCIASKTGMTAQALDETLMTDRKSTRLNSSH